MTTLTTPPARLSYPPRAHLAPEPRALPTPTGGVLYDHQPARLPAASKGWLLLALAGAIFLSLPLLVLAAAYATSRLGPAGYLLLCGVPPLVLAWDLLGRASLDSRPRLQG